MLDMCSAFWKIGQFFWMSPGQRMCNRNGTMDKTGLYCRFKLNNKRLYFKRQVVDMIGLIDRCFT